MAENANHGGGSKAGGHKKEEPIINAPEWLQGFITFVREQGVVGVGVGLILGFGLKSVVDSLVTNLINPLIGMIGAGDSLSAKYICLNKLNGVCANKLGYGALLSAILSFIIMAAIVYFMVKGLKLDKLDKKKPQA